MPAAPGHRPLTDPRPRALPYAASLVIIGGIYFVAGKLGLTLASIHPSASAIWPGTGIALAALLVLGTRIWPAIFIGAFLVNATTAGSLVTSLGIALGNTLEGVVGAMLVNRFAGGRDPFVHAPDTFRYAGLVAMACMVSASVGFLSLVATEFAQWTDFGPIWLTWWLGDLGGALVVAPFLLLWSRDRSIHVSRKRAVEAAALLACLVIVGWIVFRWVSPLSLGISLMFLCVPPLMWAAYRFDQRMGATALLILAAIAVGGTLGRFGLSRPSELNQSLLVLQVFLGLKAVTTLVLAAVVAERRRVTRAVQATSDQLREAVAQLEAFNHAISHDLRSPIGTMLHYAVIIKEDYGTQIGEAGVHMLQRIEAAADSAVQLLDQLVQVAWAGSEHQDQDVVDMTALAREAYAEVVTGGQNVRGVRFDLTELPSTTGSAALLGRIFPNLLSNSFKYTRDREHPHIEVRGMPGRFENTYTVTDNGIGFDPAESDSLFEPFRRLSGARRFEGSGLGLAIAAKIVHKHGGRIWAESDGSSWARFSFTLPNGGNGS
jgi:signal transduction histidine kinase